MFDNVKQTDSMVQLTLKVVNPLLAYHLRQDKNRPNRM